MNPQQIRARVAGIRDNTHDDESAHASEDELHQDVLAAIADGADNPAALAREALATRGIDFARWCG